MATLPTAKPTSDQEQSITTETDQDADTDHRSAEQVVGAEGSGSGVEIAGSLGGARERTLTEKGAQYEYDKAKHGFKASLSAWRSKLVGLERLMSDSRDPQALRDGRDTLESYTNKVIDTYQKLKPEADDDLTSKYELFEESNLSTLKRLTDTIRDLEYDIRSRHSNSKSARSSVSSKKSSVSSKKSGSMSSKKSSSIAEAAGEIAALQAKLKYTDTIGKQKIELNRLKTQMQIEQASARLEAITEVEKAEARASLSLDPDAAEFVPQRHPTPSVNPHGGYDQYLMPVANTFARSEQQLTPAVESQSSTNDQIVELARELANHVKVSRLPAPEPGVFHGSPLNYMAWKVAFETLIEQREIPAAERIHFLKRYLGGEAKECVEGYFLLPTDNAYHDAKALLEKRYGDPFTLAGAFRDKLDDWPKIGNRDSAGLRKLADFLRQCNTATQTIPDLNVLNDSRENRKILGKLPEWLVLRWSRKVASFKETHGKFPPFSVFSNFLGYESDLACDPITSVQPVKSNSDRNQRKPERNSARTLKTEVQAVTPTQCIFCGKQYHHIDDCRTFLAKPLQERKKFAAEKQLCFGCLEPGHLAKGCKTRRTCKTCSRRHPTALHGDLPQTRKEESETTVMETAITPVIAHTTYNHEGSSKSSMIVPIWLSHQDQPEREVLTYALLDSQSDTTFISERTRSALELKGSPVSLSLSTMSAQDELIQSTKIDGLIARGHEDSKPLPLPHAYTRETIPANRSHIPTPAMTEAWPHLRPMEKHLMPVTDCDIGLLIGYNCPRALAPLEVIVPEDEGPFAQKTALGWGIVGVVGHNHAEQDRIGVSHNIVATTTTSHVVHRTQVKEVLNPNHIVKILEQDFQDVSKTDDKFSQEDRKFLELMEKCTEQCEDGHYQMPLPLRSAAPPLPDNKAVALVRFKQLQRRFNRDPTYRKQYTETINGLLEAGYAEPVPAERSNDGSIWYIPHHGVYHPHKPNKLRVVFDGSSRYENISLNDTVMQGPDLTNSLIGVLCRFREERIAFTCDIEAMFHQFRVTPCHRDLLRFLWYPDGDFTQEPTAYRMTVHLFGAKSSPSCANYGLRQIANDGEAEFGSETANFLRRNFYVDDGLKSVSSEDEAIALAASARKMCAKGGLRLHKFTSNSAAMLKSIDEADRSMDPVMIDMGPESQAIERALGVEWCVRSDCFQFRITLKDRPLTRRGVLSTVCAIYDPLGFIAPVTLVAKQILQQMCSENRSWDDPLSEEVSAQWERWRRDLPLLENHHIKRCFIPANFGAIQVVQLHHFSDASTVGYGQCSYLRMKDIQGRVHCSLVIGKARVSPRKPVTIPRLELSAALLSTKISGMLHRELQYRDLTEVYWTDSQVVLGYLRNDAKRFHVFVANRVQQIKERTSSEQWQYVSTDQNPADIASRGSTATDLMSSKWLTGPEFLWKADWQRSTDQVSTVLGLDDPEVRRQTSLATQSFTVSPKSVLNYLQRYSSWTKLRRVVAVCLKLRNLCQDKAKLQLQQGKRHTSLQDLATAEQRIISLVQQEAFPEEWNDLSAGSNALSKPKSLKSNSPLKDLDPFMDSEGLMRVGGRLKLSREPLVIKHPVILPKNHHITVIIIKHFHVRIGHQGRSATVGELRANGIWILCMTSAVSSYINRCVTCRKLRGRTQEQKMADLPQDRLEHTAPFTNVGVDYFGPWIIKQGRQEIKRWGVIFTCLSSRAVHLETANSLTTDSFIHALRRLIALRGPLKLLRCDRGTNFVGAERELKEAVDEIDKDKVDQFLTSQGCQPEFRFNVPSASHFGGVWERQIRTVRNILAGLLLESGSQLNDESLRTFLCEVAAIMNSKPLGLDNLSDPQSPAPLTPNHLLTLKSKILISPPGSFSPADMYSRKHWRRVQHLANVFWFRWKREYVHQLQKRQKWTHPKRDIKKGDIVLIKDEDSARGDWRLARIENTIPSSDGHVRKARVRVGDPGLDKRGKRVRGVSYLDRPIQKLVLLLESECQ